MIPFRTQYEKLIRAYLNNEVQPDDPCACFIGNLLNGNPQWVHLKIYDYREPEDNLKMAVRMIKRESGNTYTPKEILQIEGAFMRIWNRYGCNEESLFKAFEHGLVLLRKLHESKGEVIEDYSFKKRELLNLSKVEYSKV